LKIRPRKGEHIDKKSDHQTITRELEDGEKKANLELLKCENVG